MRMQLVGVSESSNWMLGPEWTSQALLSFSVLLTALSMLSRVMAG